MPASSEIPNREALPNSREEFGTLGPGHLILRENQCLYANASLAKMLGCADSNEITSKPFNMFFPESQWEKLAHFLTENSEEPHQVQLKGFHADGSALHLDAHVKKVEWEGETALLLVMWDISSRVLAEQTKLALEKLESLGEFATGLTHSMSNILTSIVGHSKIITMNLKELPEIQENIKPLENSLQSATQMVETLRLYASQSPAEFKEMDLNTLAEGFQPFMEAITPKEIKVDWDLQADLPPIHGDSKKIQQVLNNLALNAIEAIDIGENRQRKIHISTGLCNLTKKELYQTFLGDKLVPGNFAFIEVNDSGSGIKPHIREKMFDPFFSTKFTGRGMGLATCLGTINAHKGGFIVKSFPDTGSTFTVLFPVQNKPFIWPKKGVLKGRKVLLLEEDPHVRKITEKMLIRLGYAPLCLASFDDALKVLHSENPDLVLLSASMFPDNTQGFLQPFREIHPKTPFLIMSGRKDPDPLLTNEKNVFFIKKPFQLSHLKKCLEDT